ncbi:flagellar assembly protein FliW [Cryobacterium sp. TmT2-59]|uniref:Flagellar assembly protein FliW n=1 Tax=Cryobacterium shii TaxID=1259235 RepID=A0AAQ2C8N4_9MICO|nr:flagellar assembly protein FliW [Cryobacterium shii]TFC84771.1 flagellar assembly protein FliW [Cryobacterium sp. TmT2-59]TFD16276.1 flagellar assembly protein FliW [Cryobacterium sp. TMT2-23]TFD19086.1 flagellar assembly protein FliW [Cryobacterium sp. TMT4-10]
MSARLTFVSPPPGLAPLTEFALTEIPGAAGLFTLQAAADAHTRLFVLDASVYLPDYSPVISDDNASALELAGPDDALILVVTNPGEGGTTVNLMAPIVVNARTGCCAQIILEGQNWPLRAELGDRSA